MGNDGWMDEWMVMDRISMCDLGGIRYREWERRDERRVVMAAEGRAKESGWHRKTSKRMFVRRERGQRVRVDALTARQVECM